VGALMALSVASWVMRVPSMNHRRISTAWVKQPSDRRPLRVPRRRRSACSRLDKNSTISRRMFSVVECVTREDTRPVLYEVDL
jgi:hypothetical protein